MRKSDAQTSAILLFSGGLDSLLAAKILLEQHIRVVGLYFILPFSPPDIDPSDLIVSEWSKKIGISMLYHRCGKEYMKIIENPSHGYGKNLNPCVDCRLYFLRKAKEVMEREGASFVATGEVVGQRPMSQMKHMLNHLERESSLSGFLLRPLSAKVLKPTQPERDGIVNRDLLLGISGRSRKVQMKLADRYDLSGYPSPAGGCPLTDRNIARRLKDVFTSIDTYSMIDIYLLTVGRHFRLTEKLKIIVSRDKTENDELEKYKEKADYFIRPAFKGPSIFLRGVVEEGDIDRIGTILLRYRSASEKGSEFYFYRRGEAAVTLSAQGVISDSQLKKLMI